MNVEIDVHGIELGGRYRDTLTDFEGTASGVWLKLGGNVQVSLAYVDTTPKEVWIDATRLAPARMRETGIR